MLPTTHAEHDKASKDTPDDIEVVRQTIIAHLDQGKNVVLVAHSYGAIPAMAACTGLDSASRTASGKPSSVVCIACIPGAIPPPGFALASMYGGKTPPFFEIKDGLSLPTGPPGPAHLFYNDIPEEKAKEHIALMKPQSEKIPYAAAPDVFTPCKNIPVGYIICTKDNVQLPMVQYKMVEELVAQGFDVHAVEAECGHSPFLSKSEETARFVRKLAGEDIETGFKPYKPQQ